MVKLYLQDKTTIITTLLVLALLAYIVFCILKRGSINNWGWLILGLALLGLIVCCYAATRDGLDKTIQNKIDGSVEPGIFKLISVQNIIGCIGATIIIISGIIAIFVKKQDIKEILFFIMSSGILLKVLTIEISRTFIL